MTIVVFGATGQTGRRVVAQALATGQRVRAVSRSGRPADAGEIGAELEWLAADIRNPDQVRAAVADADAVISAVGMGRERAETTIYSDGVRNIIAALPEGARLAVVSAGPVGPMKGVQCILRRVLWAFFGGSYRDMTRMEAELAEHPELAWVCLRPPYLRDAAPTGAYRLDPVTSNGSSIATGDLADALIDAVTGPAPQWHTAYVAGPRTARRSAR